MKNSGRVVKLELLESTYEIRKALGEAYVQIRSFDRLPEERLRTNTLRRQLLHYYPRCCAGCQELHGSSSKLEAAHIFPLEEGGITTEPNIVLLCHTCHKLYDAGYASLMEMEETAASWRDGEITSLRETMRDRERSHKIEQASLRPVPDPQGLLDESEVYHLVQARKSIKAIRILDEVKRRGISNETLQVLTIVQAQIHRRRAARNAVTKASQLMEMISLDQLPAQRMPLYFYELGFVKQIMGSIREASDCFLESFKCACALQDEYAPLERLMAWGQYLATEIIAMPPVSPTKSTAVSIGELLDKEAERAKALGGAFGGRWELNCRLWKINMLLKLGDFELAGADFNEASELRAKQNVTTGWTASLRPAITAIRGLLLIESHSSSEQIEEGLQLLARSIVPMLQGNCQRPEGIRDRLLWFEQGLHRLPRERASVRHFAEKVRDVRKRIVDGSSFVDPSNLSNKVDHEWGRPIKA